MTDTNARGPLLALLGLTLGQACTSEPLPGPMSGGAELAGAGGQCEPSGCAEQGVDCGDVDDGCGNVVHCGGACSEGGSGGSDSGSCTPITATDATPAIARRARSSGFSGKDEAYSALFDLPCDTLSDCVNACADAGGSETMCAASECLALAQADPSCLPAPIWSGLENLPVKGEARDDMTQIIVVPGTYHDYLLADQLRLEVPPTATILGLTVEVIRTGSDAVVDGSVKLIKAGEVGGAERAEPAVWTTDLTSVKYGGAQDLWGREWTPADVNAADFGVAFAAAFTRAAGNARAYVDTIEVTVHYEVNCE